MDNSASAHELEKYYKEVSSLSKMRASDLSPLERRINAYLDEAVTYNVYPPFICYIIIIII